MKERGLIFSGPMIRANLDGRKTQTRRTRGLNEINVEPDRWKLYCVYHNPLEFVFEDLNDTLEVQQKEQRGQKIKFIKCPYGVVGDRFYMRETYVTQVGEQGYCRGRYKADGEWFCAGNRHLKHPTKKLGMVTIPCIHMPKWAARPERFEITDIRLERVQDITAEDIQAEGIDISDENGLCTPNHFRGDCWNLWRELWDSVNVNAKKGYKINPWVFPISYRKL